MIRDCFVPSPSELRTAYVEEARRARKRRKTAKQLEGLLHKFPTADGRTLAAWVHEFLTKGEALDRILDKRANTLLKEHKDLRQIQLDIVQKLNELRDILIEEQARRSDLPDSDRRRSLTILIRAAKLALDVVQAHPRLSHLL